MEGYPSKSYFFMIFETLFSLAFSLIPLINCKRILIISDFDSESLIVSNLIRSINENDKIEEFKDKFPSNIVNNDNEVIYNTIYNLKSKNSIENQSQIKWTPEEISKFVNCGGNFFTTSSISENTLNQFGLESIEGEIESFGNNLPSMNHQHAFSVFDINPDLEIKKVFKLRNDPKNELKFNALIQSAMFLPPGSSICPSKSSTCSSSSQSLSLMATLESRKGSRFIAVTSLKLINKEILQWVQGSSFNIKISSFSHGRSGAAGGNRGKTELQSTIYRVNDCIDFNLCLIDGSNDKPFDPVDPKDFQLDLKMMNIQLRKSFESFVDGCLTVNDIQLPSKPAVYTLRIIHNRPGLSQLNWEEKLLVRPYRHDEFPRFLPVAFPYYASWIGILVASYFILLPNLFKPLKKA